MSLIEVKNNLLKFCYEEDLALSGFVRVTDDKNSYIAQVLHLEATRIGKVAVAKILFMFNNGEISSYNGSIPSLRAEVSAISSDILLNTLDIKSPLKLGTLAQQNNDLYVDLSVLNDNPIICAEKFFAIKVLLNNIAIQLQANNKKVVVFDTVGVFGANKLSLRKDFKLPLNTSAINYIYEHGFADTTPDTKALIQSIFEELSEYSKTVPFIPFKTFKSVVDSEFARTKLIQLILLKNKIKQIGDLNVYGETDEDFVNLVSKLINDNTVVIDISGVNEGIQKECIKYVYSILAETGQEYYSFLPLSTESTDKELLTTINNLGNVHTTIICGYDYAYLNLLKQASKNMLMFTPLKQQKDFGGYNIFLQKLAEDEFIAYGKMTKFVPLIVKLRQIRADEVVVPQQAPVQEVAEPVGAMVQDFVNSITPESVNIEVSQPVVQEEVVEEQPVVVEPSVEAVVEPETTVTEPVVEVVEQESVVEEPVEVQEVVEQEVEPVVLEQVEGEPVQEVVEDEVVEAPVQEVVEPVEEVSEVVEEQTVEAEPVAEEVVENPNSLLNPANYEDDEDDEDEEEDDEDLDEPQTASEELTQAMDEVPDLDDDDELSDDDLDMIESLSTPDEEVVVEAPVAAEPVEEVVAQEPVVEQVVPQPQPQPAPQPQQSAVPEVKKSASPTVPEYSAEIPQEDRVHSEPLQQGDVVFCQEFGQGVVEKMINYGEKELCSINFESVGRRLLNPELTEIRKV